MSLRTFVLLCALAAPLHAQTYTPRTISFTGTSADIVVTLSPHKS
jgi:hypothetical protein